MPGDTIQLDIIARVADQDNAAIGNLIRYRQLLGITDTLEPETQQPINHDETWCHDCRRTETGTNTRTAHPVP